MPAARAPAEDDPALVAEIGRIAVRHAMLETLAKDLIGFLLKVSSKQANALGAHLTLKNTLEMAGSLAHETLPAGKIKDYILTCITEAEDASKKRNAFIHQLIGYKGIRDTGLHAKQIVARGDPVRIRHESATVVEAGNVALEIGRANMKLVRVVIGDSPWDDEA